MKRLVCKDSIHCVLCLITFLITMSICVMAQDNRYDSDYQKTIKMFTPSSPQASMFQRFGNYPVDYSTGVPHISIPLYTIKVGDFELPISIDYHNSGIRVQDIATPVGLGWMLNAGGCINRTIMGTDDMDDIRFVYNFDFFGRDEVFYKMEDVPWFMSSVYWDAVSSNDGGDTQVDRYSYNFCGNSGAFRYNLRDKQYNTIPYSDTMIEAIDTKFVHPSSSNTSLCKVFSFKITDHNGTEYFFDYPEIARGDWTYSAPMHVTSYYLTKIVLPNQKDSIVFVYDEGCLYSTQQNIGYKTKGDEYYISSSGTSLSLTKNAPNDYSSTHTTEQAETLLREIRWNGNSMMFEYVSDRPEVLKYTMDKRIHRLSSAVVRDDKGTIVRSVEFGNKGYVGKHPLERRMMLDSISICGIDKENTEKYKFEYDNGKLPPYYWLNVGTYKSPETDMRCHEDYWGYSNGTATESWIPAEFKGKNDADGDRNANPYWNKAGSLTSITYPTGGKTVYDMECNRLEDGTPWGGLRVKSITNYDVEGKTTNKRTYKYEDAIPTVSPYEFSNMFNYFTKNIYCYDTPSYGTCMRSSFHDVAVSNPCVPLSANYGSPIHYYKVTEYHGTENDNTGYDIYEYETSFTNDISTLNFYDTDEWAQSTVQYYSDWGNFDEGNAKLLLHQKSNYDALGNLQSYQYNNYEDITVDTFRLGTRVMAKNHWIHYNEYGDISNSSVYMDYGDNSNFPDWLEENFSITDVWAIPSYKRLASTTECRDGVTTKITYGYDEDKRTLSPKSKSVSIANNNLAQAGSSSTTTYTYPFESASVIAKDMTRKNMLVPLKTTTMRNSTVMRTDSVAYGFVAGGIQQKEYYTSLGTDTLEKRLTYSYDSKGRVQSLTTDAGDCTVFVWGNRNDWPIAKIEGKTLQEIKNIIGAGMYQNIFYDNPNETMLFAAKDLLQKKNCSVIVYDHETLVGVKSVIHPNNNAEYFDYDSMGRLIRRKENNATREEYQYNYRK